MFEIFSHYPTFLVFLAIVAAIVVTMVLMPVWIKFLKSSHIGQQVRADGPESHLVKQGTPTMGGVIMLVAVIATALVIGMPTPETFLLLGATVLTGLLGLVDDASKVVKERSLGLTPKAKLVGQFAIATVFTLVAVNWLGVAPTVEIPFVYTFDLGLLTTVVPVGDGIAIPWLYLLFMNILLVGMCNAVNLTDGLDGLAAGTVMIVMIVMAAIAYRSDMLEPAIFAAALAGAPLEFVAAQDDLLDALGLPALAWSAEPADMLAAMKRDKKARHGQVRFVLPRDVGSWELRDVDDAVILEHLEAWARSKEALS